MVVVPCIDDTLAEGTVEICELMEVVFVIDAVLPEMLKVGDGEAELGDERLVVAKTELGEPDNVPCEKLVLSNAVESDNVERVELLILLAGELVEKVLLEVPL